MPPKLPLAKHAFLSAGFETREILDIDGPEEILNRRQRRMCGGPTSSSANGRSGVTRFAATAHESRYLIAAISLTLSAALPLHAIWPQAVVAHPVETLVPFAPGQTWYICLGYDMATHAGSYALDVTSYHNTVPPYGCVGGNNSPAGKWVTAPGSGVLSDAWSNGACFKFDAGGSMKLGHIAIGSPYNLQSKVDTAYHYMVGQQVSEVLPASQLENNNIAHLHTQAYTDGYCGNIVPMAGSARLDCVKNLAAGTDWRGTQMRRCESDVATFYDGGSGSATEHVWTSNGSTLAGATAWYSTTGYTLAQVGDRFVSGDFNGDGKGDTATFYDYGSGTAKVHVWLSTGSSLAYQGSGGWWSAFGIHTRPDCGSIRIRRLQRRWEG